MVGPRLAGRLRPGPETTIREFSGSPLDLIGQLDGYLRLVVVDSIVTGKLPVGTVTLFGREEILGFSNSVYPHGMNLPEVIALAERMNLPLPEHIHLVGIEIGRVGSFSDRMDPELESAVDRITDEAAGAVREALSRS